MFDLIYKGLQNPEKIPPYIYNKTRNKILSDEIFIKKDYPKTRFDTEVGVIEIRAPADSYYSERAPNEYEPQVVECLSKYLDDSKIFYDIGSYFGYHIEVAKLCGVPPAQIHAFEANEFRVSLLKHNCTDSIHITNKFVGRGQNSISIDEYTKSNSPPDVIKIDVEGEEYEVLKGAEKTLEKHHPSLIIEVHPGVDAPGIIEYLYSREYMIGTVYHQMLRTETKRDIKWLSDEDNQPILEEEKSGEVPFLLVAERK